VIQINGVLRGRVEVPAGISEEEAKTLALGEPKVSQLVARKKIVKTIYVPNRLINLVIQ